MRKFLLSAILFLAPISAYALGQMTEPIVVDDAIRGQKIQREIIAVNSDPKEMKAELRAEGQISAWTKFYLLSDLSQAIATATIPAGGDLRVAAVMDIPKDIPNGKYIGALSVVSIPDDSSSQDQSSAKVAQKIDRAVAITISDKETVDLEKTSVIPETFDLEAGSPLNIRVIYDNQGNISLSPQIRLAISREQEQGTAYDMIYPFPADESPLVPGSQHEIKPLSVATAGWATGAYEAKLTFSRGEEKIMEKSFRFSVVEKKAEASAPSGGIAGFLDSNKKTAAIGAIVLAAAAIVFAGLKKSKKSSS